MKTIKITLTLFVAVAIVSCHGQTTKQVVNTTNNSIEIQMQETEYPEIDWSDFDRCVEIANADYGTCYTIGQYMLCPEKKMIRAGYMFGTAIMDCYGYFPEPKLKYDEVTMIIFAGFPFFDNSGLNIDWETAELLSYDEHISIFTDGKTIYYFKYGDVSTNNEPYNKNTYKPSVEEKPKKMNYNGIQEITEDFCVKDNIFYYGSYFQDDGGEGFILRGRILETFDVPNLRTIVSKNGFETNYITDGKQVIFGGSTGGYSSIKKEGIEYVLAEKWILKTDVDFASLRVLGKDMMMDKNALYCRTEVIPFDKLKGFKFIFRELDTL